MTDPQTTDYFEPSPAEPEVDEHFAIGVEGEGTAGGYFNVKTPDDAERALAYFADRCRNCQYEERCPGEPCAVYRAEKQATEVIAGVVMRPGLV